MGKGEDYCVCVSVVELLRQAENQCDVGIHFHSFSVEHGGLITPLAGSVQRCLRQGGVAADNLELSQRSIASNYAVELYRPSDMVLLCPGRINGRNLVDQDGLLHAFAPAERLLLDLGWLEGLGWFEK